MQPRQRLYLVRHGESAGNVNPVLPRREDPPLTDRGRAQARAAARALAPRGIARVFSSPLRRARETAQAIAADIGVAVEIVDGLTEVDMGSLSDPRTPEERALRDAILAGWLVDDRGRSFPAGEDWVGVVRRVEEELRGVMERWPGRDVAIVTHRVALAAAASLCTGVAASLARGACANGSITTLVREDAAIWTLERWGDATHLAAT